MTKTAEIILFCVAFLSQILLVSWFYARRVIRERRYVLQNFPPSTHPKLYTQPIDYYERKLRGFWRVNVVIMVAGLLVIGAILGALFGAWDGGVFNPSGDQQWDTLIVVPFFMVQTVIAVCYLDFSSFKHQKAMALAPPPRVRTTELQRRRLTDLVSPLALLALAITNLAFVVFVLYYRHFGYAWFTAAGNIAGVAFMLLVFCASVAFALYAPKPDPYLAQQDRHAWRKWLVQGMLGLCIAMPVLITVTLIIKSYDADSFEPFVTTLYCLGCAAVMLWPRWRVDRIDYDVYRDDARNPAPGTSAISRS